MFDTADQLDVFPTTVEFKRVEPAQNMRRFYRITIQRDLFGGASLVRERGRIGSCGFII